MKWLWITFVALICDTQSIQNRMNRPVRFVEQDASVPARNFRHIDASSSANFDWEHGLREATTQALFRENVGDHDLRKRIYAAPLLGKQNKATPFGDIAVLARGQIYANYAGFIFVQDPYQNDCDDCHAIETEALRKRCIHNHCQIWHPRSNEQLIALWSIKRIRHRSLENGHNRLEIEFTISPIGLRHPNKPYLTKEGTFNYNMPGHVFILRSPEIHKNLDNFQKVNHFKHGAFIAQAPDGTKYILHSFPGILTPQTTRLYPKDSAPTSTVTTTQYSEEDAKKVYQTLLEVLHKKTSLEPHHRFTPPTPKTSTTFSGSTLLEFPNGQVIPITELEVTKTTPEYVTVRFPTTSIPKEPITTPSRPLFTPPTTHTIPPSIGPTTTTSRIKPQTTTTKQSTTQQTTFVPVPQTPHNQYTLRPVYTKPTSVSQPQYHITTQSVTPGTTTAPVKMTFHFFAAEEDKPTTPDFSKKPLTTIPQRDFTKIDNILPDTVLPTKATQVFTLQSTTTTQKLKETTRTPFTSISSTRPGTVIKVTKPIQTQTTLFTNEISTYEPSTTTLETTTTKKPYSVFTVPITVLEGTSTGTTWHESTIFEESTPITQTPFSTIKEPTETIKYTNTEFYNPTTKLTPETEGTTVLQATTSIFETKEPITETTYIQLTEGGGSVETTMGMTTMMGKVQNKTTEMVYYASEEIEQPITSHLPNLPTTAGTEPTNTLSQETESMSTPKRIVTTIAADGTVSVKTTPFYPEEELFGSTKSSTRKYKTTKSYKVSTTEPSDFLIENGPQQDGTKPLFKKPLKDYSEDEIFGQTKSVSRKPSEKPNVMRKYTKSDVEQALFDNNRRKSKALLRRKSSTTPATPSKVLYSDFFEASTLAMATSASTTLAIANESTTEQFTRPTLSPYKLGNDKTMPVTSQSYLTSISYEVNKRKKPITSTEALEINETSTNKDIMKERIDVADESNSAQRTDKEINNDFALRLLGQAKGVAYLDKATTSASTVASTSAKTTKKSRYTRRRSYVARSKKLKRKKGAEDGNSR